MDLLNLVFPPLKRITHHIDVEGSNSIDIRSIAIYGKPRSGKTEIVRDLVQKANNKYGEHNVNVSYVEDGKYFPFLVKYGLDDKLVQILICDNATLTRIPDKWIAEYFSLAHRWREQTGRPYGYVLAVFIAHRLHGLQPVELRTNLDAIIFRSGPSNIYDRGVIKKFIGDKGYKRLCSFDLDRRINGNSPTWNKSPFWIQGDIVGEYEGNLATKNYLTELLVPNNREALALKIECDEQ